MPTDNVIPPQEEGAQSNTEHEVKCEDINEAKRLYEIAKERLLNVSEWGHIAGMPGADFQLTDDKGNPIRRKAQVNDFIKIDVPGPGSITGDGFDWVKIEVIDEEKNENSETERIIMQAKPASNPTNTDDTTAHFFKSAATSNFVIRREKTDVSAAVLGRNELPNQGEAEGIDKIRNTVMATGAVVGLAKVQWSKLIHGFLEK